MTKEHFWELFQHPYNASGESLKAVKEITEQFPYFNSAHLLYAKLLKEANHIQYDNHLKVAAAYAPERRKLFELMERKPVQLVTEPSEIEIIFQQEIEIADAIAEAQPPPVIETSAMIVSHDEIFIADEKENISAESKENVVDENKTETHSFLQWLSMSKSVTITKSEIIETIKTVEEIKKADLTEKPEITVSVTSLIEKFITDEPRIAPAKAEFYSPVNMARKSIEEYDDLVSPTLAQIYFMQGNAQKAIETYHKLILLYPEKSAFFAAQIEKIEKGS